MCQGRASKCVEAEPLTVGFLASSQCSAAPNYLPPLAFLFYDGFFLPCSGGSSELSGCVMRHAVIRCSHTIPPYLAHCTTQHHTAPHSGRGGGRGSASWRASLRVNDERWHKAPLPPGAISSRDGASGGRATSSQTLLPALHPPARSERTLKDDVDCHSVLPPLPLGWRLARLQQIYLPE